MWESTAEGKRMDSEMKMEGDGDKKTETEMKGLGGRQGNGWADGVGSTWMTVVFYGTGGMVDGNQRGVSEHFVFISGSVSFTGWEV